ncbi:hypothetical protein TNCV_2175511 [Trichonephila clavipes]|uniref:Uncharacterized protein n=1 Tax=Trichonephila clavipes TaxID=2585209 RepID=A0A8X6VG81_TRICX|nr:hypothetical protein TNCV_2175511 [Trichonephila clavipes]
MERLPYCNLYRSKFGDKKFGDQKWVLLGFNQKNCADGAKLCTNETEPSASNKRNPEHSMAEAVREAVDENDGKRDLAVAVDGSWQKRGFFEEWLVDSHKC